MKKDIKPSNTYFINAAIRQIEQSKYKPTHVKYHNGKEWVDMPGKMVNGIYRE